MNLILKIFDKLNVFIQFVLFLIWIWNETWKISYSCIILLFLFLRKISSREIFMQQSLVIVLIYIILKFYTINYPMKEYLLYFIMLFDKYNDNTYNKYKDCGNGARVDQPGWMLMFLGMFCMHCICTGGRNFSVRWNVGWGEFDCPKISFSWWCDWWRWLGIF